MKKSLCMTLFFLLLLPACGGEEEDETNNDTRAEQSDSETGESPDSTTEEGDEENDSGEIPDTPNEEEVDEGDDPEEEDPDTDAEALTACEELSLETCKTRDDCSVTGGRPIDMERKCKEEYNEVSCETRPDTSPDCGDLNTFKTGPDGRCYRFSTTCTPPSWDDVEDDPACSFIALKVEPLPCDVNEGPHSDPGDIEAVVLPVEMDHGIMPPMKGWNGRVFLLSR